MPNTDTQDQQNIAKMVKVYVKIRDKKELLTKVYDEEMKTLDAQMDKIKSALLEHCKAEGVEGGRTEFGTFSRTTRSRYWTNDWNSMGKFIVENGAVDLLEKRIHQGNMKSFLEDNPDVLPPGLNVDTEYTISVRRPTK